MHQVSGYLRNGVSMPNTIAVELRVVKAFGGVVAVDNLSLSILDGEFSPMLG